MRVTRTPSTSDLVTSVYTIRRFPSATGHVFFQVMSPLGHRVYESTEYERAATEADRRNAAFRKEN